ncbi:MAG: pilus assembly protein [Lautropia sp.]
MSNDTIDAADTLIATRAPGGAASRRLTLLAAIAALALASLLAPRPAPAAAPYPLADQPVSAKLAVPANVLLDLSVEWPTGDVQAHNDEIDGTGCPGRDAGISVCYFDPPTRAARYNAANATNPQFVPRVSMPYIGYFDPYKCYAWSASDGYFSPTGYTSGFSAVHHYSAQPAGSTATCSGAWSGNFLNWASMQTIDMFRWAMTGGDRRIDTPTLTVLQKARHDGGGGYSQFPIKRIGVAAFDIPVTAPSSVTPYSSSELHLRVSGLDTGIEVSTDAAFTSVDSYDVSVRVCVPGLPETITPCTAYGSSLKPTGLVQENADQVRFGAFGYLFDPALERDGGVLRSRIKFVGPQRPTLTSGGAVANPRAEWRETDGTFITNPEAADAAATTALIPTTPVTQSGLIQYLNRFGRKNGYKQTDPFSELYYESLRYLKKLGPTPEYADFALTPGTTAEKIDGFPVITNWEDPLAPPAGFETAAEWCPKNFIIGIADSNTWTDKRLPGNTETALEASAEPSNPDGSINVSALLNEIIATESGNEGVTLLNGLGLPLTPGIADSPGRGNSAYVAALAYHANTRDIRPDSADVQTHGKQTVKTFMIDVREAGSWGTGVPRSDARRRNQLWLTGKYGGFGDLNGNGLLDAGDALADVNGDGVIDVFDVWDNNGDLLPDTYFEASSPEAFVDGLRSAFATIRSEISSNATVAVATKAVELQAGNGIYQVSYDQGFWSGDLLGYTYGGFDDTSGLVTATKAWSAAEKLEATDWDARRIVTSLRTSAASPWSAAIPFRWTSLSPWQKARLNDRPEVLEFLRGRNDDASMRRRLRSPGTGLALVPAKLGDIVDSAPRHVAKPPAVLSELFNPGYASYATTWKDRKPMIYVGANDGMLHAFDARIDHADGGKEAFAYVPSFLFGGVTAPAKDGLLALTNRNYLHRYFVNASPISGEVDFARTNGAPVPSAASSDWRTVLVGGLGKGGRGFYALDVTDPGAFTSETAAAGKVLWEFSDPTMGFSYGEPQIVKTRRWGWVVLLTSGYNNTTANGSIGTGKGYLYVVDVKTGALLQAISTGSGTDASPSGLAQVTAYVPDAADGTVTEVYGGDLDGKIWRFDFTSATGNVPAPTHFATLIGPDGVQPVTTGPVVRAAPISRKRYVFVGTGTLLGQSDIFSTTKQSFYALRDGTRIARWESGVGGAPTFPITRSIMIPNATLLAPIVPDPAKPAGWYHDLTLGAERVVIDPQDTDLGKISWLGSAPNATQLCTGESVSRLYLANFETGQSQLYDPSTLLAPSPTRITYFDPGTTAVGLRLVRVNGNLRGLVSGKDQSLTLTQGYLRMLTPKPLNWREITEPGL